MVGAQLDSPEVARVRSHAHCALHLPRRELLPAPSARETHVQGIRAATATVRPGHLLRASSQQVKCENGIYNLATRLSSTYNKRFQ